MNAALSQTTDLIEAARREARALDAPPPVADLAEGYRIQAELVRRSGAIAAWKIGALTPAQQARLAVDTPLAAAISEGYVHASPATLPWRRFIKPLIECEFAFVLGRDLPVRAQPYSRAEVEDAIAGVCPTIEVVDSRVGETISAPVVVADNMANAALIHGEVFANWRALDIAGQQIALQIRGREVAHGSGAAILGDPLAAVVILANTQPPVGNGLKARQIVTTGSCTGMTPVFAGDAAIADFGALGTVALAFTE